MSVQETTKTEEKPNEIGLLFLFAFLNIAAFCMVMVGSSMIGDALGSRSLGHGIQIIASGILIPVMLCCYGIFFQRK